MGGGIVFPSLPLHFDDFGRGFAEDALNLLFPFFFRHGLPVSFRLRPAGGDLPEFAVQVVHLRELELPELPDMVPVQIVEALQQVLGIAEYIPVVEQAYIVQAWFAAFLEAFRLLADL